MKFKLTTKIFAGFLLLMGLFAAVVLVNYRLAGQVLNNSGRVELSQQISAEGTTLLRNIIDMETGFRGFLIVGNEQALDPYYQGERELLTRFSRLRQLALAEPEQVAHITHTQHLFQQWLRYSHLIINEKREAHRRQPGLTSLEGLPHRRLIEGLVGKQIMDQMRHEMGEFDHIEQANRQHQRQRLTDSIERAQWLSGGMGIAALVFGLFWALYIVRLFSRRIHGMVGLARQLAGGDYKAQLTDYEQDEVSVLTTALNGMARTVDANISQLEARNQELDQFAYVVSHDLKAPLRGIESASRWIEEDMGTANLPDHIREFLGLMRQRVHRMENLITGILDLARVGRVAQANEVVFVRPLLREVIDYLNLPTGFNVELPFFLPTLTTNRIQLQQVFSNLLSNALKYHDHPETGLVTIGCDDVGDFYRFSVADNGPGIAPEYHERIFIIFQTLVERDTLESTGVGLAIVKKIVERQGGRIRVESVEGQGANFIFTWPKLPPVTSRPETAAIVTIPAKPSALPLPA